MMDMNPNFTTNFVNCCRRLEDKYGYEFVELNGFSKESLDFTNFIKNFIDEDTVADASVDSSSNVNHKDIVVLMKEMSKPQQKLIVFHKIFYEINKAYGYRQACKWLELEWNRSLYMHDAPTASLVPYCYKGEETLVVKDHDKVYHTSLAKLYEQIDDKYEKFDESIQQVAKFPEDLYVRDCVDGNVVFTRVYRVVKHSNSREMRFIKYSNGNSQIVTDDHPIITERGDIPAKDLQSSDKVFTVKPAIFDDTIHNITITSEHCGLSIPGRGSFELTRDLGWLTGIILSDGSLSNQTPVISQDKNSLEYDKIIQICDANNIPYTCREDKWGTSIALNSCPFSKWMGLDPSMSSAQLDRCLPNDYIHYAYDFLDGVVAGYIDGDGSVWGNTNEAKRGCSINTISETMIHQLSTYLQFRGSFCSNNKPCIGRPGHYTDDNTGIHYDIRPKHPLHGIYFNIGMNEDYLMSIGSIKIDTLYTPRKRKKGIFANKQYTFNYGYVKVLTNEPYASSCDVVYDITTASGHFICNNIVSHNCYAYDLRRLAEEGQFFQEDYNYKPPKHLTTFVDFVKEFVSYASNRTSGACGLPNLIPYMYYFWDRDMKSHYFGISEEFGEKYAKQAIQRFIYAVNQTYVRDNCQSAFTNTSVFDMPYLEALFGGAVFPDGSFMIDELDGIMQFQKWYMEEMCDIRGENMFTFPVNSISLLKQNGKFIDEESAKWFTNHNMKWLDSNIFCSESVTSLSNCCRLKSSIKDMGYFDQQEAISAKTVKDLYAQYLDGSLDIELASGLSEEEFSKLCLANDNSSEISVRYKMNFRHNQRVQRDEESLGFQNSIGGTSLKVGSVKVSTINLARIALENDTEDDYVEQLKETTKINLIALDRVRHIIKRNHEKGLLPNYCEGLIDLKTQYNTIGIIGVYETMKSFGYTRTDEFGNTYYKDEAFDFGNKIFEAINEVKAEFAADKDYMINIEQVPGEQAAVKFLKADTYLYPDKVVKDLPLYGNQFIPLGIKATLKERIKIAAAFDDFCNGGSIAHINVESPFTSFDQMWDMLNYITDQGLTYFAFNAKINACEDNHAFFGDKCTVCGKPVAKQYTRIVGFFVPINEWSKERKAEGELREWEDVNNFKLEISA